MNLAILPPKFVTVVVQHIWQQIPLERVQSLVSRMPGRVRALVDTELSIHWD